MDDGKDLSDELILLNQKIVQLENLLADKEVQLENSNLINKLVRYLEDSVYLYDSDEKLIYINAAAYKTLGYSEDELIGMNFHDLFDPQSENMMDSSMEKLTETNESIFKAVQTRKDGSKIPVEIRSRIIAHDDKPLVLSYVSEITNDKKDKSPLLSGNEPYNNLIDGIGIGMALISPKMEIIDLNNQMKEWFPDIDVSKRPICYESFNNPPREDKCMYCPTYKTLMDGNIHESITNTPQDDETVNYRIISSSIKDDEGKVVAAIEMVEDITERKKAEHKHMQSEEKFRAVTESTIDAIITVNSEGIISFFNNSLLELFGYSAGEIKGKNVEILIPEKSINDHVSGMELYESGEMNGMGKSIVVSGLKKEGTVFPCEMSLSTWRSGKDIYYTSIIRDLTERQKAEKLLKESEEKFRLIFQNANDMISLNLMNEDGLPGRFIEINETGIKRLGYTHEEILNMGPWDIVAHESREDIPNNAAVLNETGHNTFEILHRTKKGVKIPIEVNNHLIHYKGLEVCLAISRDITKRKQTEEALIESEIKYRTIFEHTGTAIVIIEEDTTLSLVNTEFERLSGFKKEDVENKIKWTDLVFKDDIKVMDEYHKLRRVDPNLVPESYEFRFVDKYNNIKNVLVNVVIFPGTKKSLASLLDITQLKNNEKAVKEQYHFLQHLIDTIPYPIFYKDVNFTYVGCNKIFEETMGLSKDEIVGKTVYDISPRDLADTYNKRDRELMENGSIQVYEAQVEYADGSRHNVIFNKSIFRDLEGNIAGLIGIMVDITERIKAEEELRESHNNLELKVKERTHELEEVIDEFKRSNKELKEFAHVASHDLREPLRMITTFLQLLEIRYQDQLDDDANEFIGYAVNGAKRLDEKIKDLLKYSQVSRKEIEYGKVNCEKVLEETLINLTFPIEESNAIIIHDPLPVIRGNEKLMVQLFQNIIGNAIKYRREETPKIHISATQEDNHYLFSIRDNGIGIDSNHLERIFTIFQRLHTDEEYEGTGIGLAIAQKIVEQMRGEIWAESELGKGSTFYFTVPI